MFTPEIREKIRSEVLEMARQDSRISGGAITGSAAVDRSDQWSDIDLAFGVESSDKIPGVLKDFTATMYGDHGALHHLDVLSGSWIYRVFFLANTLQVDLAFVPQSDFGPRAPTFKLVFGDANPTSHDSPSSKDTLIGWAWLYALHARSCIQRGEFWRAEYMISGMRDQVVSLCCLRHELPERQGCGVDRLPEGLKSKLEGGLIKSLDEIELQRAFKAMVEMFLEECAFVDDALAARIEPVIRVLY